MAGVRDDQADSPGPDFEWPRYPRILVAVDETPAATFALRHMVPYAVDQRSRLTLLSVVARPSAAAAVAGVSPQRLKEEMDAEAERRLRRLAAALPPDLPVTTVLRHGDPAREILGLVGEQPVDLICMGARGRGRVGVLLGSVSTAVLRHSPVPVLVFHPPPEMETGD